MTQHWLILKTDPAKEFVVAEALSALGHTVWVPTTIATAYEKFTAGPGVTLRRKKAIERPLMPCVALIRETSWMQCWAPPKHLRGFWADEFGIGRTIPEIQVTRFRERVEAVNAAEIARIKKAQMGKRKSKKTLKLEPNLADELKAMLFGQQLEEAA